MLGFFPQKTPFTSWQADKMEGYYFIRKVTKSYKYPQCSSIIYIYIYILNMNMLVSKILYIYIYIYNSLYIQIHLQVYFRIYTYILMYISMHMFVLYISIYLHVCSYCNYTTTIAHIVQLPHVTNIELVRTQVTLSQISMSLLTSAPPSQR